MASRSFRQYEGEPCDVKLLVKLPNGNQRNKTVKIRPLPPGASGGRYPRQCRLNREQILVKQEIQRLLQEENQAVSEDDQMEMVMIIGNEEKVMDRESSMSRYNHELVQSSCSLAIRRRAR